MHYWMHFQRTSRVFKQFWPGIWTIDWAQDRNLSWPFTILWSAGEKVRPFLACWQSVGRGWWSGGCQTTHLPQGFSYIHTCYFAFLFSVGLGGGSTPSWAVKRTAFLTVSRVGSRATPPPPGSSTKPSSTSSAGSPVGRCAGGAVPRQLADPAVCHLRRLTVPHAAVQRDTAGHGGGRPAGHRGGPGGLRAALLLCLVGCQQILDSVFFCPSAKQNS